MVDARFRSRRVQNWLLLGVLYALFYMSRYNYSATSAYLASIFGWRNADLGIFETVMPLVYGLSVVLNGPAAVRRQRLSDLLGCRSSSGHAHVGVTST